MPNSIHSQSKKNRYFFSSFFLSKILTFKIMWLKGKILLIFFVCNKGSKITNFTIFLEIHLFCNPPPKIARTSELMMWLKNWFELESPQCLKNKIMRCINFFSIKNKFWKARKEIETKWQCLPIYITKITVLDYF